MMVPRFLFLASDNSSFTTAPMKSFLMHAETAPAAS
jgi:hypothetical protein